ncbi:MAG: tetratricopeptide repeat protein [Magnetococcales bacterium]|nr:tetratricopeptide repeat protein [Magnetococcales bacterium]
MFSARQKAFALYSEGKYSEALAVACASLATTREDAYLLNLAAICQVQLGSPEQAIVNWQRAIALQPDDAALHNNLGTLQQELKRYGEAEASFRCALRIEPGYADAHYNLGLLLQEQRQVGLAEAAYRRAIGCKPDHVDAQANLGVLLQEGGRFAEAEAAYRQALHLRSDHVDAQANLAVLLHELGRFAEAEVAYRRLLSLDPGRAATCYRLGVLLQEQGRLIEAEVMYRQAVHLQPDHADACANLGLLLRDLHRLDEAEVACRQALCVQPDHVEALTHLGVLLRELHRLDEAEAAYRQALRSRPEHAAAHYNLGILLKIRRRFAEAEAAFRQAIHLEPTHAAAHDNLGILLSEQLRLAEARVCHDRVLEIHPDDVLARWSLAFITLLSSWHSPREQARARDLFRQELSSLEQWFADRHWRSGQDAVGSRQPFFLAYHDVDNRELLTRYGELCARLLDVWYRSACQTAPDEEVRHRVAVEADGGSASRLIRVGIVSKFFFDHSVWHALIKGWLLHFDRNRFKIMTFATTDIADDVTQRARELSDMTAGPKSLGAWVESIHAARLDVLIYPEVGMDVMSARLAALRLVPLQMVAWGHPETTGLPTLDYYISAELFESEHSGGYHSEKLIRLPHLGSCFSRMTAPGGEAVDPARWGLSSSRPILICAGTPFKYNPCHDDVFVDILRRIEGCQLVFFAYQEYDELRRIFSARLDSLLEKSGLNYSKHVIFLPWLSAQEFHGLLRASTAMLDTLGFSGFNTVLQAVECGLPVVTLEGRFRRGRLGAGILRRLGLADIIAGDVGEYAELAARFSMDEPFRRSIQSRMAAALPGLFEDLEPVEHFQSLLEELVRGWQKGQG